MRIVSDHHRRHAFTVLCETLFHHYVDLDVQDGTAFRREFEALCFYSRNVRGDGPSLTVLFFNLSCNSHHDCDGLRPPSRCSAHARKPVGSNGET